MSDIIDEAQVVEERERDTRLGEVRQAARRCAEPVGVGECAACGEAIENERRAAVPGAVRCIECQEAHERLRRLFPGGAR